MILHTPKNGFFFVVDRESGKPLAANALVRTSWASGWDLETGKPKLTPEFSDYSTGPEDRLPGQLGRAQLASGGLRSRRATSTSRRWSTWAT